MGRAYLSLGSNVKPAENLASALGALRSRFDVLAVSPIYRNTAIGFEGADFFNAAAVIESDLDPRALNDWLHALEDAHGRERSGPRFGDRPLDVDIVFYDSQVLSGDGNLRIPRPELRHAFVLKPLQDIAPEFTDPISGLTLAQLWAHCPERNLPLQVV